jgi:biopolymer transport protein ExbD
MKKHKMPEAHNDHPNVVPLIDVIMCLIVFFMLIAKFGVNTGEDEMIQIPKSILGTSIDDLGNTMVLNVSNPVPGLDQPTVSGLVGDKVEPLRIIDPSGRSQLVDTLRYRRFGADLKPGGDGLNRDNPDFRVIIRGAENLDYRYLEPVLNSIANAGVSTVAYQTEVVKITQ